MGLHILDKEQQEQLVKKLRAQCLSSKKIGFTLLEDGTTVPCIEIDEYLFNELVQAGTIDVISRIIILNLPPQLYVKLVIRWPSIKKKLNLILDGWRDRSFLEHLCDVKKLALTKSGKSAIVIDGIKTKELEIILVLSYMMRPPKDELYGK